MQILKHAFAAVLAMALVACGGGGGSAGTTTTGGSTPTTTTTTTTGSDAPTASDLIVDVDKSVLKNSGSEVSLLTVTTLDSNRNVVSGVTVTVAVDSSATFTRSGAAVSDGAGQFKGSIGIGSDKSSRLIKYTVTASGLTRVGTILVQGASIVISTTPAAATPSQSTTIKFKVVDSAGNPMPGVAVTASGIPGVTLPGGVTNPLGEVSNTFTAPSSDGTYPVSAAAAGVTQVADFIVLTPGSGAIPPVASPIAAVSIIANPVVLATNTSGSSANQAEVRALFLTNANVPLSNVRVRFSIESSALPFETLSSGSNVVYSDSTGAAKTSYIAPTTSSPTNGVLIKACYSGSDFAVGTCPQYVTTTLTVASAPVSLSIGTDNTIQKTAGIYSKIFDIQAVNAAGNYASDVLLSVLVDIEGYWKGPAIPNVPTLNTNDFSDVSGTYKWCPNEDLNRNTVLDSSPFEDTNGDGQLTPRQADVSIGFVSGNRTSATGLAQVKLNYTQDVATWLRVKITVTAGVSGSEGAATYRYILKPAKADVDDGTGSFFAAIYGQDPNCTNSN